MSLTLSHQSHGLGTGFSAWTALGYFVGKEEKWLKYQTSQKLSIITRIISQISMFWFSI